MKRLFSAFALAVVGSSIAVSPVKRADERPEHEGKDWHKPVPDRVQAPFQGLPGCDTKETDPTWADGPSRWKDGDGVRIGSDCDNCELSMFGSLRCSIVLTPTDKKGTAHCWTDYFLVGTTLANEKWYPRTDVGNSRCTKCSATLATWKQDCNSFLWTVSETISTVFEMAAWKIGGEFTATQGKTMQHCMSNNTMRECDWEKAGGGCYAIWASSRVTTVYGYKRRHCESPTPDDKANMPNTQKDKDGYYTRGMQDFEVKLKGVPEIDCNGPCKEYNPRPPPYIDPKFRPWPTN